MLRKSVETRDWLNTIEPRNVRAVMKRVVEDITAIDTQVNYTSLHLSRHQVALIETKKLKNKDLINVKMRTIVQLS